MKTIFKYEIDNNNLSVEMHQNAKILTVQEQRGKICIWAEIDTSKDFELRHFVLMGTGHSFHNIPENIKYIGTVQLHNGDLVIHVYERF